MIILFDSATPEFRLTLVEGDDQFAYTWQADRELAKGIHAFIRDRLAEHAIDWQGITGIGVVSGPGSFTGLRIGLTVANTLAQSLGVPIVGEQGEEWRERALTRLRGGESDHVVMPAYGGEAHITKPRK